MSQVPGMEPGQIVTASSSDLERGVVISIPDLVDESVKTRFDEAALALLASARTAELPPRYGTGAYG